MSESKRIQKKKLNKEDGKGVKKAAKAAKGAKGLIKFGTFMAVAVPTVKKFGKPALEIGKKIIFKS